PLSLYPLHPIQTILRPQNDRVHPSYPNLPLRIILNSFQFFENTTKIFLHHQFFLFIKIKLRFISQTDIVHHTQTIFQSKEKFLFCILTINDIVILQGGSKMYSTRLREKVLLHVSEGSDDHLRDTASEERILADYQRLFKEAGINEPDDIYSGHQTLSSNVACVENTTGEPFII